MLHVSDDASHGYLVSRYEQDRTSSKPKMVARSDSVPAMVRTVKVVPFLACDNAGYVLGRPKIAKDPSKQPKEDAAAVAKRNAFDDLLADYADANDDADAHTFLRWRKAGSPGLEQSIQALDEFSSKRLDLDPIAIQVGDTAPLHSRAMAKRFWAEQMTAAKSGTGNTQVCLSCSQMKPTVDTLPQSLQGALIPATSTANIALLSTNFPAASRGARGVGLKSAPICVDCASGAVTGFNKLAGSQDHRWGYRGDPTATIWWTTDDDLGFGVLEQPEPAQVAGFVAAPERGRRPVGEIDAADRFYALTFSGNVARLVVRGWIDIPVEQAQENVAAWFDGIGGPDRERPYRSVSAIARSCGPYVPSDTNGGTAPEGAQDQLLRCALTGSAPAPALLLAALRRAQAEVHYLKHDDARVVGTVRARQAARFALIRLTLNRSFLKENPLTQYLDEDRNDPAFLSGRLFAVRESLQRQALGGEVNATITDRYFERASSNPASVDHALSVLAQQHLNAVGRKVGKGARIRFERQLDELHARQPEGAPGHLAAKDQALWIAGYHQQRQANFDAWKVAKAAKEDQSASFNQPETAKED